MTGEIDTLAELESIWSNSISEKTYRALIDETYIEEDGKLYCCDMSFGVEVAYYPGKTILEADENGYKFTLKDFTCNSMGELYESDEEFTFRYIYENGKWVLDVINLYDLMFVFGEPEVN